MPKLEIYKPGQGKYTRMGTFLGIMTMGVIAAYVLSTKLHTWVSGPAAIYIRFGVPTLLLAALAWVMFRIVNKPNTADFMIATEGEMKKVSWSSRKEIIGSTKVVIVTTFMVAGILYGVDALLAWLFTQLSIMG